VALIKNINTFYSKHGKVCEFCGSYVRSNKNYEHICKAEKCCKSCRQVLLTNDTFQSPYTISYCKGESEDGASKDCEKCNMILHTSGCARAHKRMCHLFYSCVQCKKVLTVAAREDLEEVKDNHDCNSIKCTKCFAVHKRGTRHQCRMKKVYAPVNFTNIGTILLMHPNTSWNSCLLCNNFESTICDMHADEGEGFESSNPCLAVVGMETGKREHFSLKLLANKPTFNVTELTKECELPYLPQMLKDLQLWTKPKAQRFGKPMRTPASFVSALEDLAKKGEVLSTKNAFDVGHKISFFALYRRCTLIVQN
jgi:hypothetical protein